MVKILLVNGSDLAYRHDCLHKVSDRHHGLKGFCKS